MKKAKRAPGGGRKPEGEFWRLGDPTSVRMPANVLQQLARAAKERGRKTRRTVSRNQELLYRLQQSFNQEREKGIPAIRALCFIIERIALEATGGRWLNLDDPIFKKSSDHAKVGARLFNEWRTDPFRYRAFRLAVASLLTALEPKGEIRSPYAAENIDIVAANDPAIKELMKRTYESPENLAAYIFSNIWRELTRNYPLTEREKYHMDYGRNPVGASMLADFYHMTDARHDLGLDQGEADD